MGDEEFVDENVDEVAEDLNDRPDLESDIEDDGEHAAAIDLTSAPEDSEVELESPEEDELLDDIAYDDEEDALIDAPGTAEVVTCANGRCSRPVWANSRLGFCIMCQKQVDKQKQLHGYR